MAGNRRCYRVVLGATPPLHMAALTAGGDDLPEFGAIESDLACHTLTLSTLGDAEEVDLSIPDYQALMLPLLKRAALGEMRYWT